MKSALKILAALTLSLFLSGCGTLVLVSRGVGAMLEPERGYRVRDGCVEWVDINPNTSEINVQRVEADAATFVEINTGPISCWCFYARDRDGAFFNGQALAGVDPNTLRVAQDINGRSYVRDDRHLIRANLVAEDVDFSTLEVDIGASTADPYARDSLGCLYRGPRALDRGPCRDAGAK